MAGRASGASRASLAAKEKDVSKRGPVGHSARSLGRSHPRRSLSKKSAFRLLLSWSGGGRHRWSVRGGPPKPRNQRDVTEKKAVQHPKHLPYESRGRSLGICHPEVSNAILQ